MKSHSFNLLVIFALFLSLLGGAVTVTPAYAAGIVVNSNADDTLANLNGNGTCDLREAVTNANADNQSGSTECTAGSGADTITFAADYTITLIGSQLPAVSTQMTITGNGTTKTIIQANAAADVATYRVFEVTGTGNLTLNSLTVRHGRCNSACATSPTEGGGILNSGTLTVNNSTISGNIGLFHGGGIRNSGTLTVTNSMISSNKAGSQGGGIYNTGNAVLAANSTISGNDSSSGNGGGISNNGTMDVTNSIISGNHCLPGCGGGGGVFNNGTFTISNGTISGNEALNAAGGGIFTIGSGVTVTNSLISDNKAYNGGGIRGGAIITNSTISGNSANSNGGGMEHVGPSTITNSTFSGNTTSLVGGGGGIYNLLGPLNLVNTIIAGSTNGDCVNADTIGTNTNNLIEDGTCSPALSGNPFLGPLANNGGFTQTHALLPSSPAIDKGDAATCAAAPVSNKDQRGVTRPQGAGCDIGAFEAGPIIPVVTASNPSANAVLTSLSTITVVFNQDMLNDSSAKAANNTVNYILVERGANGSFDTTSCNGGVVSDDVQQTISTASYNSAGFISSLTLASPLANGTYRLFICGTTSIWSVAGLELNNGANDATVDFTIGAAGGTTSASTARTTVSSLPKTGFAPGKVTVLPAQPATLEYAKLGDLWLEIPSLNVKSSIVGVPQNADKTWDVTWLGNDTGWLNGTAFPTWTGNSVLTAHVTNASGVDGPFAALKSLKYGDQIIVHFGGVRYVYEVRETKLSRPYSTNYAFESKSDASYLTLVTCSGYNPLNESYLFRRVVRAVLVSTVSQ